MTKKVSRRSFVKIAGVAGAGIAGAAAASPAHSLVETVRQAPVVTPENAESAQETLAATSNQKLYVFFTPTEAAFMEAAVDRLIPKDNVGPGALELDVAHYIDLQLAGTYGNGERMYLEGPFGQGAETQGYQLPLRPREVYRIAIEDLDNYCRASFGGQVFAKLPGGDQDKVLTGLQEGKISLVNIPAQLLFGMLLQQTIEGYFADPIYGGNKDMGSWKMLGFPGAHADFRADVGKQERVVRTPISLAQISQSQVGSAKSVKG